MMLMEAIRIPETTFLSVLQTLLRPAVKMGPVEVGETFLFTILVACTVALASHVGRHLAGETTSMQGEDEGQGREEVATTIWMRVMEETILPARKNGLLGGRTPAGRPIRRLLVFRHAGEMSGGMMMRTRLEGTTEGTLTEVVERTTTPPTTSPEEIKDRTQAEEEKEEEPRSECL